MLSIKDLQIYFGSFAAVRGISLQVERGEIYGFLGPNGAGKTTTIRVLTGQMQPTSGSIFLAGHNVLRNFACVKPLFGYVPDFDNHIEEFTAAENLRLYAGLYSVSLERAAELLKRMELWDERDIRVKNFSKGMKKKLSIARELLHRPEILFLDEPTANLDVHSKDNVRRMLIEMRNEGSTIFLTTHDMEEAEEVCDRMCVINRGKIVEINSPQVFKASHSENLVDITFQDNGAPQRSTLRMADEQDRQRLAAVISNGSLLSIHSKEFNFRQVFLKLTGQEYQ